MKVLGFSGYSGAGKTTLLEQLITQLQADGVRVAVIKHAHCGFELDQPGKDSYRHRRAGAAEVLIASEQRWALLHENHAAKPPSLADLLSRLSPCDLVLVEGWRHDSIPKIEVHRAANGKPWLYPQDAHIIAVASDVPPPDSTLPWLALDATIDICVFVKQYLEIQDSC